MERCTLTQRPCRKAIAEVVEANKNRYFLQRTLEAAEILLQGSKEETRKKMSEEDEARFCDISGYLYQIFAKILELKQTNSRTTL